MVDKAQKIRVGLFAMAVGILLAVVIVVFGGMRFWEHRDRYRIVFEGSVMGLEHGAQVYLNGVKVGTVDDIEADPADLRRVQVTIDLRGGTPVRQDTRAMLQLAGITGLKVIDLRDGSMTAPPLPVGGTIPQGQTALDKLEHQATTLVDRTEELMGRANKVLDNLVALTDPKAIDGVMATVQRTAGKLEETSTSLRAMVEDNRVAVKQTVAAFGETARGARRLMDGQVTPLLANAGEAVSELRSAVRDDQGALRGVLMDLKQASKSIKDLAREVRQKPSRLLFSGAPADRRLP